MADIIRWDPMREIASMRDNMDRVFDDFFSRTPGRVEPINEISVNLMQTDNSIVVEASIPGIAPDDLNISVTGDRLLISGETKKDEEIKNPDYHIREINFGSFSRSIQLPTRVAAEKAKATFNNGLVKLTLPKADDTKAKTIKITAK